MDSQEQHEDARANKPLSLLHGCDVSTRSLSADDEDRFGGEPEPSKKDGRGRRRG
jgi:hypothetical protein